MTELAAARDGSASNVPIERRCDNLVLHKPGDCYYCDNAKAAQATRTELRIPFAGELGAPETIFRPDETVTRWSGNVAVRKGDRHSHMGFEYVVGSCAGAPDGWFCTRAEGHEGPCAAVPLR